MARALLVSDTAVPRTGVVGTHDGAPTSALTVNGAASAGSRRVLSGADALAEQTKAVFSPDDDVRTLRIEVEAGHLSHGWVAAVTINPLDDVVAASRLTAGHPDCVHVQPGDLVELQSSVPILSVYLIAIPSVGATVANVTGRVRVGGVSHAQ